MTKIVGHLGAHACRKTAAWRTALAMAAGHGLTLDSDSLLAGHGFDMLEDLALPLAFKGGVDAGRESISGNLPGELRYQGAHELLLALALGDPRAKDGADPYTETIYLSPSTRGLFGCYACLLESGIVAEVPSVKITDFELDFEYGNPVKADFKMIGNRKLYTGDSGIINTPGTLALASIPDEVLENRVIFKKDATHDSDFWIGLDSGGALSSADRLQVVSAKVALARPHEPLYVVNGEDTATEEPVQNNKTALTLAGQFEFDATRAVEFHQKFRANTGNHFKAKIFCSKGSDYAFALWFVKLRVTDFKAAISGPGAIMADIAFEALQASSAPTGWNGAGLPGGATNDPAALLPVTLMNKNKNASAPW